jgi:hypothetical protein
MAKVKRTYIPLKHSEWWMQRDNSKITRVVRVGWVLCTFNNFIII